MIPKVRLNEPREVKYLDILLICPECNKVVNNRVFLDDKGQVTRTELRQRISP